MTWTTKSLQSLWPTQYSVPTEHNLIIPLSHPRVLMSGNSSVKSDLPRRSGPSPERHHPVVTHDCAVLSSSRSTDTKPSRLSTPLNHLHRVARGGKYARLPLQRQSWLVWRASDAKECLPRDRRPRKPALRPGEGGSLCNILRTANLDGVMFRSTGNTCSYTCST